MVKPSFEMKEISEEVSDEAMKSLQNIASNFEKMVRKKGNYFVLVAYREPSTGRLRYDLANTFNVFDTINIMMNINKLTSEETKKLLTYLENGDEK